MKELIKRHYEATKKRGCITDKTTIHDFVNKMKEELEEIDYVAMHSKIDLKKLSQETIDLMAVCTNMLTHLNIPIEDEFMINIEYQETRKD